MSLQFVCLLCALGYVLTYAEDFKECKLSKHFQHGSWNPLRGGDLEQAEHELRTYLAKLDDEDGPFFSVCQIYGGTEQLVAGVMKRLYVELSDEHSVKHECVVDMWNRPWLAKHGTEITIRCECMKTVVKHIGEVDLKK